jgi:PIN domain nuclease of toxin-antitoxin system
VKVLLDTHFLVWMIEQEEWPTQSERVLLDSPEVELLASSISVWEVKIKAAALKQRGRSGFVSPAQVLAFADTSGIAIEPLDATTCTLALRPPLEHPDPFDEMLLTHAQQLGARLLTRDEKLRDHPLALSP